MNANLRRLLADRRFTTGIVAVVGGIALVIGTFRFFGNVRGPFIEQRRVTLNRTKADLALIQDLKNKDTDRDGLSDYDELYRTSTSPYLSDSDSDGVSDADEVKRGTDPNCPAGRSCGGITSGNTNEVVNGAGGAATNTSGVPALLTGQLSAAELRKLLADSGAPQTVLDATSDADLLALYRETLGTATANINGTPNVNAPGASTNANSGGINGTPNANTVASSDLQALSPAAIRQLLIQNGVDESMLIGVDDATLKSIFLQALSDVQTNTNSTP